MRRDDIRALHEERAHLLAEARSLNAKSEEEKRDLTAEEQQEFDRLMTELEATEARAARAETLYYKDQQIEKDLHAPLEMRVGLEDEAPASLSEWRSNRLDERFVDTPEYRSAIYKYLGARSVADVDVEEHRVLSKATNAAGGFTVPTGFENRLIESRRFLGSFETLSTVMVTDSGESILIPAVTAYGAAAWTSENAAFSPSDDTFAQYTVAAYKATSKVIVSEELLQDAAFDLEAYLARQFAFRFRTLQETAYINGDGSAKPTGVLPNITSITAAVGNTTTFNYTAIMTLIYTVPAPYREGSSFVVSDLAARNLRLLVDTTGQPLWATNVAVGAPDTFAGYPIYTHPDMPAPGIGNKSMMFGNWELTYLIRRVRGIGMQRQNELHSDNGQIGFRSYERLDGRVVLADAARAMAHSAT